MKKFCVLVVVVAAVVLLAGSDVAEAVNCDPSELSPCASAISSSAPPSSACCAKLKEQKPCLCGYLKNPSLQPYIPGAKRVASACGVSIPSC